MKDDLPGWRTRGYLPHFDDGARIQSVTYRLADALPADVLAKLEEQALNDEQRRRSIEELLDSGYGSSVLRKRENADIVVNSWKYFGDLRYSLHAWCVMPNHVHVLFEPMGAHTVSSILQSQKSYTSKVILKGHTRAPADRRLWQAEYFDRFIRNEDHYLRAVDYMHQNPVKAGLVSRAEDWPWSSARAWERGRLARTE